jgi:thymidine kinase
MQGTWVVGDVGWIEVIAGSMFSGKTEELIRRLTRAKIARQKVQAFKPQIDVRHGSDQVVSHSGARIPSQEVTCADDIRRLVEKGTKVVGIDEAQFLGLELVEVIEELVESGRRVIVAGLDQDYRGEPFEPVPQLMAIAEGVTKTMAVCVVCGHPANKTQRLVDDGERVLVGAGEAYEARCRQCWNPDPTKTMPAEELLATEEAGALGG